MQLRYRLVMAATALLYLGPLMAGLGGAGWGAVLAFAGLFILWLVAMRPRQWPRRLVDWRNGPAIVQVLTQAVMQLVLVTLLFALGRALGGALGLRPVWPGYLPLTLSFLAIPLGRLLWNPWQADAIDQFQQNALAQVVLPAGQSAAPRTSEALAMLDAMPRGLPPEAISDHLRAMAAGLGAALLWQALQGGGDGDRLRVMTVFATDTGLAEAAGGDIAAKALDLLPDDPDLLAFFAQRSLAALQGKPALWGHFPNRDLLAIRLRAQSGSKAEGPLRDLLAAYDRLEPVGA